MNDLQLQAIKVNQIFLKSKRNTLQQLCVRMTMTNKIWLEEMYFEKNVTCMQEFTESLGNKKSINFKLLK